VKELPSKEDFFGWWTFLYNHRWDLVWNSFGLQSWNFSDPHRHALQSLFLTYILSRLYEHRFSPERIQILKQDVGRAMEIGFAPNLDERHKAEYFKQLSFLIGLFGKDGPRPKQFPRKPEVRQIECLEILMIFIAEKKWPSNKELIARSKRLGFNYTAKDFSEMADGAGLRSHLSSAR
jgi:hypothetical protein